MIVQIFRIIVIIIVVILSSFIGNSTYFGGNDSDNFKVLINKPIIENENKCLVILIPGLGNGKESFNWNMASNDIKDKLHIYNDFSLQDEITKLGYTTMSFDNAGYGDNFAFNIPNSIKEYCEIIYSAAPKDFSNVIVIGHSIGARIAQFYATNYNAKLIMIDPTPDYLLESIKYTKHIENPGVEKYAKTANFLQMCKDSISDLKELSFKDTHIIYSADDDDNDKDKKIEYFTNIDAKTVIMLQNATHFLHLTHPEFVLDVLNNITF